MTVASLSKLQEPVTLGFIVDALGGELYGDRDLLVDELSPLSRAHFRSISFLSDVRRAGDLLLTSAACVVVGPSVQVPEGLPAHVVTENPYLYYAKLSQFWQSRQAQGSRFLPGIHASAVVHPEASIHPSSHIGPHCVVERYAKVGAHSVLRAGVWLGEYCEIGQRCLIQPGAVIGGDGFGFAQNAGRWVKIEQLGRVVIGDDVEVGANTCIDRGALDDTVIGNGVKLDNQIQIGHNTRIGENSAMAGCVGIAGSASIGANCTVGGAGMILGHLSIVDGAHVSAASVVTRSITEPGQYTGFFPLSENSVWEKNAATVRQLGALRARVKTLERQIQSLQSDQS